MERTPYASHTLLHTPHRLRNPPQFLTTSIPQQPRLLLHLLLLQIPYTDRLLPPIDIMTYDNRVFTWTWRDGDFDLGVVQGEAGDGVTEERAVMANVRRDWRD